MKLTKTEVRVEGDHAKLRLTFNGSLVVEGAVPMGATIRDTAAALRELARELVVTAKYGKRGELVIATSMPKAKP